MTRKILLNIVLIFSITVGYTQSNYVGKIWHTSDWLYVNVLNSGVWVVDNDNPEMPSLRGFINIPGNADIAIKGNYLYADNHRDLVVLDISNKNNIHIENRLTNIFTHRSSGDNTVTWESEDILTSFGFKTSSKGGSMASFIINNNFLYIINDRKIQTFDVQNGDMPIKKESSGFEINLNDKLETIFAYNNKLFIGSQNGMYILGIKQDGSLVKKGKYKHTKSCDPVVVQGNLSYITMHDGSLCGRSVNELHIVDISNLNNPKKIATHKMSNPHGLSIENNLLFLCDGKDGFKVYNVKDDTRIKKIQHYRSINAYDVISIQKQKHLIMVGSNTLFQYNYTSSGNLTKLSELKIPKK